MQKDNKDDNLRALWGAPQPNIDECQIAEALETFRRNRRLHISSNRRKKLFGSILKYATIIVTPLLTALAAWNYSDNTMPTTTLLWNCMCLMAR